MEFALPETWILGAASTYFIDITEPIKGSRVYIPRKYYTTFLGKIHTHPYLMFQIKTTINNNDPREIVVCLSGSHNYDSNLIIVPDWILEYLNLTNETSCVVRFLTEFIPEPVRHIDCSIEMTKQFYDDLGFDIRTAVEGELSDLQVLTTNMPFEFNLPEIDAQISGKINGLRTIDWEIIYGYVEPNSEVSVNFIFLPDLNSAPAVSAPAVSAPAVSAPAVLAAQEQLTAQERSRLVRESWLKRLQYSSSSNS
jgi:hypothetical protein